MNNRLDPAYFLRLCRINTWTCRLGLLVILALMSACAVKYQIEPYLNEPNIDSLSKEQVLSRWRYTYSGCLDDAMKLRQKFPDCQRRMNEEKNRLLIRLAELHPEWPKPLLIALRGGAPLAVGMKEEQLLLLMGEPKDKNMTVIPSGVKSQFVYDRPRIYVYVENGVVTVCSFSKSGLLGHVIKRGYNVFKFSVETISLNS